MPQRFIATTRTKTFLFEDIPDDRDAASFVQSKADRDGLKLTGVFNPDDANTPTHILLASDDAIIYNADNQANGWASGRVGE